jgi:hypothetical protein
MLAASSGSCRQEVLWNLTANGQSREGTKIDPLKYGVSTSGIQHFNNYLLLRRKLCLYAAVMSDQGGYSR